MFALLFAWAATASAAGPGAARKQVEASMLVTGFVVIEKDGSVGKLEIDQPDKVPGDVVRLVEVAGNTWHFEPPMVDGKSVRGRARMSLRVVANKVEADLYRLSLRSGHFGVEALTPEELQQREDIIKSVSMRPPGYPRLAMESGYQGTVYLVLKIGREGTVVDAMAEQINLRTIGPPVEMERMRSIFAGSALKAARSWMFAPPTTGENASAEFWSVRVPVDYAFHGTRLPEYGQWHAYIPGPRHPIPWASDDLDANESPDALLSGGFYEVGKSFRLLTSLQHEG
ncbi:protein tonB [Pseudoxanthomonas wuyuanensis]|nr:protein tonB [Pseudoxanthomonas wuyuanensis]